MYFRFWMNCNYADIIGITAMPSKGYSVEITALPVPQATDCESDPVRKPLKPDHVGSHPENGCSTAVPAWPCDWDIAAMLILEVQY